MKEVKFNKSESNAILMKPLIAVLTGISLTMQDADIDDCVVQINGDLFDFTIRATKSHQKIMIKIIPLKFRDLLKK